MKQIIEGLSKLIPMLAILGIKHSEVSWLLGNQARFIELSKVKNSAGIEHKMTDKEIH